MRIFILFYLVYFFPAAYLFECSAENLMPNTKLNFDIIVGRATAWKSVIGALQTPVSQMGVVVRFLYPTEYRTVLDMPYKGNFYNRWFLGEKDYAEFWRNFHDPSTVLRETAMIGLVSDEYEWLLDEANLIGEITRYFIGNNNYYNVSIFKGVILNDIKGHGLTDSFDSIPFIERLCNAKLMTLKANEIIGTYKIYDSLIDVYSFRIFNVRYFYNCLKKSDLTDLMGKYNRNLSLLSENKNGMDKQVVAGLKNIKQDEELPVAEINDNKALLALSEVLKLLEKAGIKEVHSLTILPENPNREYLCIPVKINAILTYDQLKRLSDAVSSASTLSIINFFAVANCDLKMKDVKPLLEKGLPFYQARCIVIIEFITGIPDKK